MCIIKVRDKGLHVMEQDKLENSSLWPFFLIAFAWSWFFWLLQILGFNLYVAPFARLWRRFFLLI
jgi:hypothetical protein